MPSSGSTIIPHCTAPYSNITPPLAASSTPSLTSDVPGIAARTLSEHFEHVIGLDPSEGMIASAIELGGTTGSGRLIRFAISSAEDMSGVADGSVDLLIAATAAHWFNLPAFWARAAQVLKPGGSVGLWTHKGFQFADSVPNVVAIREAVGAIRKDRLLGYSRHGGTLSRDLDVNLPMPWSVNLLVLDFDEGSLFWIEWGTGANNALPGDEFFAVGQPDVDMDMFEAMLGTTSSIARWREDNKEKVGTKADVVRLQRREIERLLHEPGVEHGKETVKGAEMGVLLVAKRA
ncbi:hypothetical protein CHU98_g9313 [Xylaria longipes]|nr:hypothetical protein CHU98_g9313 [Xylaria longipes]